ncbi:MAG: Hsp20/alpha crystallin family protein [Planctomycetota bacterium]
MLTKNSRLAPFFANDPFFNQFVGGACRVPAANIVENEDGYLIRVQLPGASPDDLELDLENNTLTLRARVSPQSEESETVLRREFEAVSFERSFRLPSIVDRDSIDASLNSGLLTVTLPKSDSAKPKTIRIRNEDQGE